MIQIKNLTKYYHSGFFLKRKTGIQDLSLHVEENQIVGFLGQNGSGKTTTIKILTGLSHPNSGSAQIMRKDILDPEVRKLIGYLPESPYFYEHLTPYESLRFYAQLHGMRRPEWKPKISELLKKMGIESEKNTPIKNFSKGMKQRFGLAQALINDPKIVILDEPSSGLDPLGRQLVKDMILELKDNKKTVFFSTHILPDVEAICDRVVLIHQGRLVKEGSIEEFVKDSPSRIDIVAQNISIEAFEPLSDRILKDHVNYYISVSSEEKKDIVFQKILEQGGKIRYIIPQQTSLEELFKKMLGADKS
jgi:ABC-2 type transport system ATP-binding protein